MATLNLVKIGSLVKVEYTGRADRYIGSTNPSIDIQMPSDGTANVLFSLGGVNYTLTAITDFSVEGDAATNQADAETKLATVFLNANSGNGGSGSFADLTGDPEDNTALAAALAAAGGGPIKSIDVQLTDADIKGLLSVEGVRMQGTITVSGQPTAGNSMNVCGKIFDFIANGDTPYNGSINIGLSLSETKENIIAAINGTDEVNGANVCSISEFTGDDAVLTYLAEGDLNDSSTVLSSTEPNITFDDVTMGATQAGVTPVPNPFIILPLLANTAYGFPLYSNSWNVVDIKVGGEYVDETGECGLRLCFMDSEGTLEDIDPLWDGADDLLGFSGLSQQLNQQSLVGDWTGLFDNNPEKALVIAQKGTKNYTGGNPDNTISVRLSYTTFPTSPF